MFLLYGKYLINYEISLKNKLSRFFTTVNRNKYFIAKFFTISSNNLVRVFYAS
jgi:hypothetical protein